MRQISNTCAIGMEALRNDYIRNLPTVTVGGVTYKFVNGIGFGIDGYCCEEGDRKRAAGKHDINYSAIAVKGCLFSFKPYGADITVDGETRHYDKVWLAPTMFGKYYGGGMKVAPEQAGLRRLFVSLRFFPENTRNILTWLTYGRGMKSGSFSTDHVRCR